MSVLSKLAGASNIVSALAKMYAQNKPPQQYEAPARASSTGDRGADVILGGIGNQQRKYHELRAQGVPIGDPRLQELEATADRLRADARAYGIDLSQYGKSNQWGQDLSMYYGNQGQGNQRNPLPSSNATGFSGMYDQFMVNPNLDLGDPRERAQRDAQYQLDQIASRYQQGYNRQMSDFDSALQFLRSQYDPMYERIPIDTQHMVRDALARSASRGFFASGLAQDAEMKANLQGQQYLNQLQMQDAAQTGDLQRQRALATREFTDNMNQLQSRAGTLEQQLFEQYMRQDSDYGLRAAGLNNQMALALMGLDQNAYQFDQRMGFDRDTFAQQMGLSYDKFRESQRQFNEGMDWTKDSFGQQMGYNYANLGQQDKQFWADHSLRQGQLSQQQANWQREFDLRQQEVGAAQEAQKKQLMNQYLAQFYNQKNAPTELNPDGSIKSGPWDWDTAFSQYLSMLPGIRNDGLDELELLQNLQGMWNRVGGYGRPATPTVPNYKGMY